MTYLGHLESVVPGAIYSGPVGYVSRKFHIHLSQF